MRWWFGWLTLCVALIGSGCLSPTLPSPPPDQPEVVGYPDAHGMVRLQGAVPARRALVQAINERTDHGAVQLTDTGRYDLLLEAREGDWLTLSYVADTQLSSAVRFRVPRRTARDGELRNDAAPDATDGGSDVGESDAGHDR